VPLATPRSPRKRSISLTRPRLPEQAGQEATDKLPSACIRACVRARMCAQGGGGRPRGMVWRTQVHAQVLVS